ncbi:MAG: hypothetical protein AB7R89_01900 [Dehalococcoidia bacterium]
MALQSHICQLYEPDGRPLATGTCPFASAPAAGTRVIVSMKDRPGHVIQRCLLGRLCDVRVQFEGGTPVPAQIERAFFDPKLGRACVLRVEPCEATIGREDSHGV